MKAPPTKKGRRGGAPVRRSSGLRVHWGRSLRQASPRPGWRPRSRDPRAWGAGVGRLLHGCSWTSRGEGEEGGSRVGPGPQTGGSGSFPPLGEGGAGTRGRRRGLRTPTATATRSPVPWPVTCGGRERPKAFRPVSPKREGGSEAGGLGPQSRVREPEAHLHAEVFLALSTPIEL